MGLRVPFALVTVCLLFAPAPRLLAAGPETKYITDIKVLNMGKDKSRPTPDEGYELIFKDLSRGAGGYYLYFQVKREPASSGNEPITAVDIIYGGSKDEPPRIPGGFYVVRQDLNEKAGGEFVWLMFSKDRSKGPGILNIDVLYDAEPSLRGYTKIGKDLSKGAGGKDVWLMYFDGQ